MENFKALSLRQKANFKFTNDQWKMLTKEQKTLIFNARKIVNKGKKC